MPISTVLVATVRVAAGVTIAAWWDGGREIGVHVDSPAGTACVARWPIWNEAWDCPLIEPTRESFERFVQLQLEEPGLLDALVGAAEVE